MYFNSTKIKFENWPIEKEKNDSKQNRKILKLRYFTSKVYSNIIFMSNFHKKPICSY